MSGWPLAIHIQASNEPMFRRIAAAISTDIERSRLQPGERLPSSRALATQLGVNRNTVIAAYDELRAGEWISSEPARGTFVAARPPKTRLHEASPTASDVGFDLGEPINGDIPVPRDRETLLLLGGVPDLRFLPQVDLARAYRTVLRGPKARHLLDYGDPSGNPRLRRALAELLARRRGMRSTPDSIACVRGSQQGLYLASRSLICPGDVVCVEALGHPNAWKVLRLAGAVLRPIPVDEDGMQIDALEKVCANESVRAVVVTPHHQYPTGVALSPSRRDRLLALATRERMIIFEDDYDFDFHYDETPLFPLAASDRSGVVVYFGTMSKTLAPGLRLGYVVAPPPVIERMVAYRTYVDTQGDHVLEEAVACLLEEGIVQRHADRALRAYRGRRDFLCAELDKRVRGLEFQPPRGGMSVWGRIEGVDTGDWVSRALAERVAFQSGQRFAFDRKANPFVRIGFAACSRRELARGVEVLSQTLTGQ